MPNIARKKVDHLLIVTHVIERLLRDFVKHADRVMAKCCVGVYDFLEQMKDKCIIEKGCANMAVTSDDSE